MSAEPMSAYPQGHTNEHALDYGRRHLERLGYQLLEQHRDRRTGALLLVARSHSHHELVFCELRAEALGDQDGAVGSLRRRRLRRAAHAWLAASPEVHPRRLRLDRLTVFLGHDGLPVGLEHQPQAF